MLRYLNNKQRVSFNQINLLLTSDHVNGKQEEVAKSCKLRIDCMFHEPLPGLFSKTNQSREGERLAIYLALILYLVMNFIENSAKRLDSHLFCNSTVTDK